ncbi:unnamed protein product [Hermetia illucens]|uniref:Uncharacterized protein n=1 Tax=Hermetia illucens TaxID=343691 RepID=A0A7R8Z0J0_HERIL|nr:unnamed protein product [Hermetia illucens]
MRRKRNRPGNFSGKFLQLRKKRRRVSFRAPPLTARFPLNVSVKRVFVTLQVTRRRRKKLRRQTRRGKVSRGER